MSFLLRTLSLSYVRRHLTKTLLTLLGVVVGVATFSAIRSAQGTLVKGIRSTVDRVAGKAHLQITTTGGVPEEVQEKIRTLPGIRAISPIIEQIVVPQRGELGSLMVIGIDLLGDREMREYGFEGEDADLDDPLLFLARPDSAIFTRDFAGRAGLKTGDTLPVRVPAGVKRVAARGLLSPKGFAEAFGGNLMVVDVYAAQELFGRGRRFDRIDVRLAEGTTVAQGTATLKAALGPVYRVETPDRRGKQMEQTVNNFVAGFNVSSGFALAIGIFLIFNAFNVAVNRRRRDIGTLRALGATPRQVQAIFLMEALVIGLIGGAAGCLAGGAAAEGFLRMMGQTTETIYGISSPGGSVLFPPGIVLESMVLGIVASLVGAWNPSLAASRISPTEAFAKGVFLAKDAGSRAPRIAAGPVAFGCAVLMAFFPPYGGNPLILSVLALGAVGMVLLVGPLSRLILRLLAPLLMGLSPVAGRLCSDALLGAPRRTSGTVMAMALSLTFVLGIGGYMGSMTATMVKWMDDVLTSDFYVRASANWSRPDFLFPGSLRQELLKVPGVRAVESVRTIRPLYQGHQIVISSYEVEPVMKRIKYEYFSGNEQSIVQGVGRQGMCYVSENFQRRFNLGVGQAVELETPTGIVRFPIAAVVRDYGSDQGSIFLDRNTYLRHWQDDRVDIYDVSVVAGADVGQVRNLIRAKLAGKMPALISTRQEFIAEIKKAIDAFHALTRVTVFLALVVAFLGIVTSLLISVAERTREIGVLKALGAIPSQIVRSVVAEALVISLVAVIVAIPAGNLFASFMEGAVARFYTGWSMSHEYPWEILAQLLVALPFISTLAAWMPARQAARLKITEAIEYE
ncbi:FtsX-like permease family protein [Geobacter grbiciae]|uniref:FtsX-like permease family protein n=1 Tax=Geobacter grbiciae TaxID=155042 RepID=UPI001C02E9AC|nr:FtsX-like permease family protein [Geobacter grbiciae]MBT1075791.1 FtsX-like permease family protein [Geobacter grbiciae]